MSKQEKQQFLFTQIIDGGYDPQQFQQYLQMKKPGGLDINKWDLQQLKNMVYGFKQYKLNGNVDVTIQVQSSSSIHQSEKEKKKFGQRVITTNKKQVKSQSQKQPNTPINKISEISSSPDQKTQKANQKQFQQTKNQIKGQQDVQIIEAKQVVIEDKSYGLDINNEQLFSKSINCMRTEPNSIFTKKVDVKIQKYQKMEGGFFEQGYVVYRVVTNTQMWAVMRRYTDFEWLRNQLNIRHPGYPIPPIAKKGAFRKFDDDYLKKRMSVLQNFMNKILTVPELKAEQIVEDFLKIDDPILYVKAKKQLQFKDQKVKLQKLNTLNGRVNLVIDPNIAKYMSSTQKYLGVTQLKMEKVYKDWKQLSGSFDQSVNLLKGLNHTFEIMERQQKKFYSITEVQQKQNESSLYKLLCNMTSDWANILEDQHKSISQLLYGVYKYEYINLVSLSEVVKKVHLEKNQYLEYRFKIQRLKQKLYEDRNFAKMDLPANVYDKVVKNRESVPKAELFAMMLPKDMQQQEKLKQSYALLNFQCYEEIQRYFNQNPKALAEIIEQFATRQSINTSKSMMLWADTITDSMSLKQGKKVQQFEM